MPDRSDFGLRQADMTARWYENIKATHGDVDAYIRTRYIAYMDRWREAGRFIADGSSVLEIGGGNLFPELLDYFKAREFKYSYADVDPAAVDSSRALAEQAGLTDASFSLGFNDQLDFPTATFDAVFSSHCIEHSIDLSATFRELNRVLKPNGNLLMPVPFGWEINLEHPYFLGPDEWARLTEDGGFSIRIAQIGNEYPEMGEDYLIAASKISEPKVPGRIDPILYLKDKYDYTLSTRRQPSHTRAISISAGMRQSPLLRSVQ